MPIRRLSDDARSILAELEADARDIADTEEWDDLCPPDVGGFDCDEWLDVSEFVDTPW